MLAARNVGTLRELYDPAQPRDDRGQWSGGASTGPRGPLVTGPDGRIAWQTDSEGRVSVLGISEDRWTDWALESDNINDILAGDGSGLMMDVSGTPLSQASKQDLKQTGEMIQAAAETHAVQGELWRGEDATSVEQVLAKYSRNKVITLDRLTSAAVDAKTAATYATGDKLGTGATVPVVIRMQRNGGTLGIQTLPDTGVFSGEVVMPKGETFRVSRVSRAGDKYYTEEIRDRFGIPHNAVVVELYNKTPAPKEVQRYKPWESRSLRTLYSDAQARDDHGRWTVGGATGILYHGTAIKGLKELKPNQNGVVFLTPDKHAAEFHTVTGVVGGEHSKDGELHQVKVKVDNPIVISTMSYDSLTSDKKWLAEQREAGHDAVVSDDGRSVAIFKGVRSAKIEKQSGAYKWLAFNPDQPRDPDGKWSGVGFHGTTEYALHFILEEGIKPNTQGGAQNSLGAAAFISTYRTDAEEYAKNTKNGVVLEVHVPEAERENFKNLLPGGPIFTTDKTIPPEWIKAVYERRGETNKSGLEVFSKVRSLAAAATPMVLFVVVLLEKDRAAAFNPDQPRDETGKWSGSGGIATSAAAQATQEQRAAAQTHPLAHPDFVIGGSNNPAVHRYVAAYGEAHTPAPLPEGIEQGAPRECYKNASLLVMGHPELTYAEGFAKSDRTGEMVFQHAWAVTKDGVVVDPTWDTPEKNEYFGVRYERAAYLKYLYTAKIYGVLGSTEKNVRMAVATGGAKLRAAAFNPEQPRDEHGRWTDTGGHGTMLGRPASDYTPSRPDGLDTQERFSDGHGHYTPQRAALHEEIIAKHMAGVTSVKNPTVTVLGGAPGVGKSTTVKNEGIGGENTVLINPDDIRNDLPEYAPDATGRRPALTAFTHEEASDISAKMIKRAAKESKNAVLDGTGDSSIEKLGGKVAVLRSKGARVEAVYVTTSVEVAQMRADARSNNPASSSFGRVVPPTAMREMHKAVSRVFPEAIRQGLFDRARLFDSTAGHKLVASAEGRKLVIHDQAAWDAFVGKGQ